MAAALYNIDPRRPWVKFHLPYGDNMKSVAITLASLFAASVAFAQAPAAPAKKEEAKPAAAAPAKKEEKKEAKKEVKKEEKKDAKK
jgi:ribosomal protein L12E/L44/L45/RPP1/RPP2